MLLKLPLILVSVLVSKLDADSASLFTSCAGESRQGDQVRLNHRVIQFGLAAMLLALVFPAEAQQAKKMPRIDYISGSGNDSDKGPYVEALRQGLRELGHLEGKTFVIEYRGAEGKLERVPALVDELIQTNVDVLVIPIPSAILRAKQATKTIPIVIVGGVGEDLVTSGVVDSLARPGGNITGVATLGVYLSGKRLELLMEAVPGLSRVTILRHFDARNTHNTLKEYEAAAHALKIKFQSLDVRGEKPDLEEAFKKVKGEANALITITSASLFLQRKRIAELAIQNRLPSMYQGSAWIESGGLMSYSSNDVEAFRRSATYVDRILKGTKPAELPIEQPTKFELVINLKTAKEIGLVIPQSVLVRADRVIK